MRTMTEPQDFVIDFTSYIHRAAWLESLVGWAVHPDRPRDAGYRLSELQERWDDYLEQCSRSERAPGCDAIRKVAPAGPLSVDGPADAEPRDGLVGRRGDVD